GAKPDLQVIKVFGCGAYTFIPPEKHMHKLAPHSELMIFIGVTAVLQPPNSDPTHFLLTTHPCFSDSPNSVSLHSAKFLSPYFLLCFSYCDISLIGLCLLLRLLLLIIPISCPCSM
ncbi:hypothetical protein P691DRAFT_680555, partial [Macrolepiota fuliginosa MF-IS2]